MNSIPSQITVRQTVKKYFAYKKRQAIVEHPYGIIKRQWGFYYISTKKGMKRAIADVGLMFVAFNLSLESPEMSLHFKYI